MLRNSLLLLIGVVPVSGAEPALPTGAQIDTYVAAAMMANDIKGLAIAVIDEGRVVHVNAYGKRNAAGATLQTDTIMYGASLTKTVVAYHALQLVDRGLLDLDKPIASYLEKPLPDYPAESKYADWSALRSDSRWMDITPRMCLTHSTGFHNFGFMEPDGKLKIHFDPGAHYSYSGDGFILLQFAIEQGLKLDVGDLTADTFAKLGMRRTSLIWRPDFAANLADGWDDQGRPEAHDERSKVRAAGSMDTTIADMALFAAALMRGEGLKDDSRAELVRPQISIPTATQFPILNLHGERKGLHAGLGVAVFAGPQGPGFFKGGHNNITGNLFVGLEKQRRAIVLLSNDVRAELVYAELIQKILGDTGVPLEWEYGASAGKS